MRALLALAAPIAAAQVAQMVMAATDAVMMGRIGSDALAAGSLAINTAIVLIVIGFGLVGGMQPLIAHARGACDDGAPPRLLLGGLVIASTISVPVLAIMSGLDGILVTIGEPERLASAARSYALAYAWGIPAALWGAAYRNYLSAMERPRVILIATLGACLANLMLNWILVFGHWGAPRLGLPGSGYATAIVNWGMLVVMAAAAGKISRPKGWLGLDQAIMAILALGWAIAGIGGIEVGLFCGSSLLIGLFGATAIAAHQVCLNVASMTFMVPFGIGQAATVRVGYHSGRGDLVAARRAGRIALAIGIGFMAVSAIAIRFGAMAILRLYMDPAAPSFPAVAAIGVRLLALAAAFQLFDGAQAVTGGVLRGLRDTRGPLLAGAIGYWGLGMPIGVALAFWARLGPAGIWWGFIVGLAATASLLLLRLERLSRHPLPAVPS